MVHDAALNTLNYANVIAYIVNAFITYLVGTTSLFGESNEYVSAKYQTIVTPAGAAFSIWAIIFTLELLFVVVQCTQAVRATDLVQKGVGWAWVSACAFQCAWTLAFAQEKIALSTVLIVGIFFSLGIAVKRSASIEALESYDFICRIPLVLHFSWLAAATALNFNILVVDIGGTASDQLAAGFIALALVLVNACLVATKDFKGRAVPAIVAAWAVAFIGQELDTPMDKEICEAATGGDECNMISEIFDKDTITGVQKTAYALAIISGLTAALAIVAGLTRMQRAAASSMSSASNKLVLPTLKAPLIQY